ncbi:hypothetical protein C8J57DRAFT_1594368 [Mycena rebaudengoi]|nr:hypothetical protein C8J57DRAFT_1594368 [Mycena rebaudengoi]
MFSHLVQTHMESLQQTPAVHHIDRILGVLFPHAYREEKNVDSFIRSCIVYVANRNSTASLFILLQTYTVNRLWPQIASRIGTARFSDIDEDAVKAIWQLWTLGCECNESKEKHDIPGSESPYHADLDVWVLAVLPQHCLAYNSAIVLIKLNILSTLYRLRFEAAFDLEEMFRHPLLWATATLKTQRLGLISPGANVLDDTIRIFTAGSGDYVLYLPAVLSAG